VETTININELREKFATMPAKNQLQLIPELLTAGNSGLEVLMNFLLSRKNDPNWIAGKIYQSLYHADSEAAQNFINKEFPQGIVPLKSEKGLDYLPLERLLVAQDFQAADRINIEKLCELAGESAIKRKWLYFTEVEQFPITDLQTINQLWLVHSEGKFGFSVQKELWLGTGKNFVKLWEKIAWKKGNNWTRYPGEFIWDLSAPRGHLPLANQLRGSRVITSLLSHPAWG
jgi:GUN4-like/ARM-like repeat domain, GUN4-N terminal